MSHAVIHADALTYLRGNRWLVQNGFIPKAHAILCDPPYGLAFMGKHWDTLGPVEFQGHLYSAYYNAVGEVVTESNEGQSREHDGTQVESVTLVSGIQVTVSEQPSAPGHFPGNAVELDLWLNLPWLI